jgi:hypothetical protein
VSSQNGDKSINESPNDDDLQRVKDLISLHRTVKTEGKGALSGDLLEARNLVERRLKSST